MGAVSMPGAAPWPPGHDLVAMTATDSGYRAVCACGVTSWGRFTHRAREMWMRHVDEESKKDARVPSEESRASTNQQKG